MNTPQPSSIEASIAGYDIRSFLNRGQHVVEILTRINNREVYHPVRQVSPYREGSADYWLFELDGGQGVVYHLPLPQKTTIDVRVTPIGHAD